MRYAKKSVEELQELRRSLVSRIATEQPDIPQASRWIRESLGLNQRDFATLVGLSTPQIARLERGEANPTLDTLQALGKPFGLKLGFCHPDFVPQEATPPDRPLPSAATWLSKAVSGSRAASFSPHFLPKMSKALSKVPSPPLPDLKFTKKK